MLCPEVWDFTAPDFQLSTKTDNNADACLSTIEQFPYSHLVSVILPEVLKVPESVLLKDCDYYKIKEVQVDEFISKDFVNNFIRFGTLFVISVETRIDCDNCFAITPKGELILHLNKESYQTLGLQGHQSHFHIITGDKYIVTLNLKAKNLEAGRPSYARIKACLAKLKFDIIITWEPPKSDVCPSSVAKYFHDLNYEVELCETVQKSHVLYSTKVPTAECESYSFLEWLGMIAVEGNMNGSPDNYLTTYETPEPNKDVGQIRFLQWRGFFTTNQIMRLFQTLRDFCAKENSIWVAMYVQGFSDSAVGWRQEEHHFYTNGDNSYTFVITKNGIVSHKQECSRKRYKNKRK